MSSTQIVINQLDSHKEDLRGAIKAVGCSRAGAVWNMGDVNGDSEGIIEGLVLQSHHPANENNTGTQLLSSSPAMSVLTIITSSKPTGKKFNFLKGKQPAGKVVVKSSSSSAAYKYKSSSSRAAKVTQTAIPHGMQGTMNWVTDIFKKSVIWPVDLQAGAWDEVLDSLQTCKNGLSLSKQKQLVILFMKDPVVAQTYNKLVNEDLRQSWIVEMFLALVYQTRSQNW